MNLDALVKQGCSPWAPAPGVQSIDIWHEYDIPTVGVFKSAEGRSVLFTLVGEPEDRLTVWAYRCLDADEAIAAEEAQFESTDDLDASVSNMFAGQPAVFALADRLMIRSWTPLQVGKLGVVEGATEFLRGLRDSLAKTSNPGTRFRAELAGVEVQTTELVDA